MWGIQPEPLQRGVLFFITEVKLTTFVSNIFHLINFWFDLSDAQGCPVVPQGSGDHKVILIIKEANAATLIRAGSGQYLAGNNQISTIQNSQYKDFFKDVIAKQVLVQNIILKQMKKH